MRKHKKLAFQATKSQGDFVYGTSRGSGVVVVYRLDPSTSLLTRYIMFHNVWFGTLKTHTQISL